ncbi:MAG: hypothetical protein DMG04_00275 [Acidobacteria bacterium]|nr:MAG: hypothetical protein DMG04_00275 [Acidobacteriota bacterium]PYQ87099.1 MAG: hypothetical protein DMG02_21610 [Acidobacteriota bacterium]PYR07881.1 MAG: hypothetical protein DMF99_21190 [Acidobacteriota bacterium]
MRGVLREFGLPLGAGAGTALQRIPALLDDAAVDLPGVVRHAVRLLLDEVRALDARIAAIDHELATIAREHPVARRLQQVPGVGVLTSTALVASVGHIHAFRRGRQFASGSASRRVSRRPAGVGTWEASANGATSICDACSRMEHAPCY